MSFDVTRIAGMENAYLLKGDHVALVDTMAPMDFKKISRTLEREGLKFNDIEFILITHHHYDHAGNAARIKALSGATLIAGEDDAGVIDGSEPGPPVSTISFFGRVASKLPSSWVERYQRYQRVAVDRTVKGGEVIEELGLEVVALPGHTVGGMAYVDRESGMAFTGDLISNFFGKPGMPALVASHSLEGVFDSQQLLADMDLDTVFPGHGRVIKPDASGFIREYSSRKRKKMADRL